MHQPPDILTLAYKQPFMQEQLLLLQEKERQIPGSVQYIYPPLRKESAVEPGRYRNDGLSLPAGKTTGKLF